MQDESAEKVEAQVVDAEAVPDAEMADAVGDVLPSLGAEVAVTDPSDEHEVMLAMDAHDVALLVDYVQAHALRKWVYELPGQVLGLTVHAVQDIVQAMNWSGKTRIGLMPDTLTVERIVEDDRPLWVATIFARDEATGAMMPGSAMEPVRMQLRESTAAGKRRAGQQIPADNSVFDPFSRTKAIQKASRNALKSFIPQEVEQTVLARFSGQQERVQRIVTQAEKRAAELPPPVTGPEADERLAKIRELYDAIKEAGDGQGRHVFTPQQFHAFLTQSQHSIARLDDMIAFLEGELARLRAHFEGEEKS